MHKQGSKFRPVRVKFYLPRATSSRTITGLKMSAIMPVDSKPFWKTIPLNEMTRKQWESLCDGCAKCCLQKLENEDTGEIHFTNIVCDLLDLEDCHCTHYVERSVLIPSCVTLTMADLEDTYWLPSTCAYRLLAEGRDLPQWHPLVSGSSRTVETSGNCIRGKVIRESDADEWEFHLIDWI